MKEFKDQVDNIKKQQQPRQPAGLFFNSPSIKKNGAHNIMYL